MRRKLLVEEKADELISEVATILRRIRYRCKASRDLERSADSAALNLAEGIALWAPKAKIAKYEIARAEAKEAQQALRALVLKRKIPASLAHKLDDIADHMIGMLTNMIKNAYDRI